MSDELINREALIRRINEWTDEILPDDLVELLQDCRAELKRLATELKESRMLSLKLAQDRETQDAEIERLSRSGSETSSRYVQMIFNDYQEWTRTTAIYPLEEYPMLGLAEETGELLGKIAKYYRDGGQMPYEAITKEAGDVLWMLSRILDDLGITLEEAAAMNVVKLESRKQRNVITGSGDDR